MRGKSQFCNSIMWTTFFLTAALLLALAVVPARAQNAVPPTAREAGASPAYASNLHGGAGGSPPCLGSGGGLNILHNFTQNENGQFGAGSLALRIDSAGNLYGTTANGGGLIRPAMVYELSPRGQDWIFTPIYYFGGEHMGGFGPGLNTVGPDGTLYGIANTPQTCGQNYECGLIFSLKPAPTTCGTALCGWQESVLHWFTGGNDGWGPVGLTSDNLGNLYGTAQFGGTYGIVYELTPSGGGWAEKVLYSFTGGSDGGDPGGSLLVGNDGNLYGITWDGGDYGFGVVYQLVPFAGGWAEHIIHAFDGQSDGIAGGYLRQDSSGNLYGASYVHYSFGWLPEKIFMLSPSNDGWVFTIIWQTQHQYEYIGGLAVDAAGNLYGVATNSGESDQLVFEIFKRTQDGQFHGWLKSGYYFPSEFGVVVDKGGNLYGTTDFCGTYGYGTVWQFTGLPDLSP